MKTSVQAVAISLVFQFFFSSVALSQRQCRFLFNSSKSIILPDSTDYNLMLHLLKDLETELLDQKHPDPVLKEAYKKQFKLYKNTTSRLLDRLNVKYKYHKETDEFAILAIKDVSYLNTIAWELKHNYNTRLVFSRDIVTTGDTLAMFEHDAQNKLRSKIYMPLESLYIPSTSELIHEITHTELHNLKILKRALDFTLAFGYTHNIYQRTYRVLSSEEFMTFSDEVFFLSTYLVKRFPELNDHGFIRGANILDKIESKIEISRENFLTFSEIKEFHEAYATYISENGVLFRRPRGDRKDSLMLFVGADMESFPLRVEIRKEKDHLDVFIEDPYSGAFWNGLLYQKFLLKAFEKEMSEGYLDTSYHTEAFLASVFEGLQKKFDSLNSYKNELADIYNEIENNRFFYKPVVELLKPADRIFELNKSLIKKPPSDFEDKENL